MDKIEALEWLQEHNCMVGEYDGESFVIVEPMYHNSVDDPLFSEALCTLEIDEYNYGYSDEFTTCSECGTVIRTSPTSYSWKPDFWLNVRDGEILCLECTKKSAEDYFEWLAEETAEGKTHHCLLNLKEHGFTKIIEDLEYGFHPNQNDDPRKLVAWANKNNLEIAFDVYPAQFTRVFDVWLRGEVCYNMDASTNTDGWGRIAINVEQVRKTLLVDPDDKYSHLRSQFREWPTPEEQCKAALRRASKGG